MQVSKAVRGVAAAVAAVVMSAGAVAQAQERVRVGGQIKEPVRIRYVAPQYPAEAVRAKVEGSVVIEAVISVEGRVIGAKVLRGVPMLDDAALEAVKQWLYTPTMLNDIPVEVLMLVNVNFQLKTSPQATPLR